MNEKRAREIVNDIHSKVGSSLAIEAISIVYPALFRYRAKLHLKVEQ